MGKKAFSSSCLLRCCGSFSFLLLLLLVAATNKSAAAASFVGEDPRTRSLSFRSSFDSKPLAVQQSHSSKRRSTPQQYATAEDRPASSSSSEAVSACCTTRRGAAKRSIATAVSAWGLMWVLPPTFPLPAMAAAATGVETTLEGARAVLLDAQQQLQPVPDYIRAEKWDLVRAALLKRPLNDLWSKASSNVVSVYAERVGDVGGDELKALELRESLSSHLRYLDMAVYNNVFNPIATQGTIGASAELVKSYYDDPTNEYKASLTALQQLIALSDRLVPQ